MVKLICSLLAPFYDGDVRDYSLLRLWREPWDHIYRSEYLKGPDLERALDKMRARKQWLPLSEAVQVMLAVCQALDYAHPYQRQHQH